MTALNEALFLNTIGSKLLEEPDSEYIFDQFIDKDIDFGHQGETMRLNRYPHLNNNGMTQIAREITPTTIIGTGNAIELTVDQVTIQLKSFAGPHNGTNPAPLIINEWQLERAASIMPLYEKAIENGDRLAINKSVDSLMHTVGGKNLKRDCDRWHDKVIIELLFTSPYTTNPGDKADGSTLITDKFSVNDLLTLKEKLESREIPRFGDGLYHFAVTPRLDKHLRQDSDFRSAVQFGSPERLYRGEIGVFEGFRFFKSTNIPSETVNSLSAHCGFAFGPHMIGMGEGKKPHIRKHIDDDYGRLMFLIWNLWRGYATLDTRHIEVVHTFAA